MEERENETMFPRNRPDSQGLPALYVKFVPENDALNLDAMYPNLSKWIFKPRPVDDNSDYGNDNGDDDDCNSGDDDVYGYQKSSAVYLFQFGKKKS